MAQVINNQNQFGGEYMVQDSDHMSGINQSTTTKGSQNSTRQADQSQASGSQQGSGDNKASRQHGGEQRRQSH